jgi:hypothetical protein
MNRQKLIELAHQADCLDESHYGSLWVDKLLRLAELLEEYYRTTERTDRAAIFTSHP